MILSIILIEKIIGYLLNYKYLPSKYKLSLSLVNKAVFKYISKNYCNKLYLGRNIGNGSLDLKQTEIHLKNQYCLLKHISHLTCHTITMDNHNLPLTDLYSLSCVTIKTFFSYIQQFSYLRELNLALTHETIIKSDYSSITVFPRLEKFTITCYYSINSHQAIPSILELLQYIRTVKHLEIKSAGSNTITKNIIIDEMERFTPNQLEFLLLIYGSSQITSHGCFLRQVNSLKKYINLNCTLSDLDLVYQFNALTWLKLHFKLYTIGIDQFLSSINQKPTLTKLKLILSDDITDTNWPQFQFIQSLELTGSINVIASALASNYQCTSLKSLKLASNSPNNTSIFSPPINEFREFFHYNKSIRKIQIQIKFSLVSQDHIGDVYLMLASNPHLKHIVLGITDNQIDVNPSCEELTNSKSVDRITIVILGVKNMNVSHIKLPNFNLVNLITHNGFKKYQYRRDFKINYELPTTSIISKILNFFK
ncbi:hypothetical protein DLAC_02226 [Tieghemostelium lacteum]|uniref:Uncharacterized protein n=1 Tax=Tieghemostelium lacteum TaxID=361077 RepID=A0A152A4F0_TIELA|nr:hypothetical protein DLAC_02226 [Tieghemostelium lacteum]|eukprot:KYR01123.1 hypothetical protein DLAC_02226 [Tieghemostelium lacteum]